MTVPDTIRRLQAIDEYRARFGLTTDRWWLPANHATHLAGWSRQRCHELRANRSIEERTYNLGTGSLRLVSGNDVVSILRSRIPTR